MKDLFNLDKSVTFLNHGSFGACPKPVMEKYREYQWELEKQPVEFIARRSNAMLRESRKVLGDFLNCNSEDFVFVSNTTLGLNIVAYSLDLKAGDEILSTDIEYGAAERMWQIVCERKGAKFVRSQISQPILNEETFTQEILKNYNSRTKILFLSHITSTTAQLLPIEKIVKFAKEKGLLVVIDGAHAPGHIPLNLETSNYDFYVGNCHKWLMSPKGAAILYAKPEVQKLLKPFIISWGNLNKDLTGNEFIKEYDFLGTNDISAYLAVKDAVLFHKKYVTPEAKRNITELLNYAKTGLCEIFKTEPIVPKIDEDIMFYAQLLPKSIDPVHLKNSLYDKYKIELPMTYANDKYYIRISLHIYNDKADVDFLLNALREIV